MKKAGKKTATRKRPAKRGRAKKSRSMPKDKPERDDDQSLSGDDENQLTPMDRKIGEGRGNLQRRADWFQKRSGRS